MHARRTLLPAALAALALSGCATYTALGPDERARVERQFTAPRAPYFVRQSLYVTPFFGDASKRLLTPVPPEDVRLLNDLAGKTINPGAVEAVLPAGTPVRVERVEFPTARAVAERIVVTPRTEAWVYLQPQGSPPAGLQAAGGAPLVLVMPAEVKTEAEFAANVERLLTTEDPRPALEALPPQVREAVRQKRAVTGMSEDALVMAWGTPVRRNRSFKNGLRVEEWEFPGGRRRATVTDGRVTDVVDPAPGAAAPQG
jgi:hypothetical protein